MWTRTFPILWTSTHYMFVPSFYFNFFRIVRSVELEFLRNKKKIYKTETSDDFPWIKIEFVEIFRSRAVRGCYVTHVCRCVLCTYMMNDSQKYRESTIFVVVRNAAGINASKMNTFIDKIEAKKTCLCSLRVWFSRFCFFFTLSTFG